MSPCASSHEGTDGEKRIRDLPGFASLSQVLSSALWKGGNGEDHRGGQPQREHGIGNERDGPTPLLVGMCLAPLCWGSPRAGKPVVVITYRAPLYTIRTTGHLRDGTCLAIDAVGVPIRCQELISYTATLVAEVKDKSGDLAQAYPELSAKIRQHFGKEARPRRTHVHRKVSVTFVVGSGTLRTHLAVGGTHVEPPRGGSR